MSECKHGTPEHATHCKYCDAEAQSNESPYKFITLADARQRGMVVSNSVSQSNAAPQGPERPVKDASKPSQEGRTAPAGAAPDAGDLVEFSETLLWGVGEWKAYARRLHGELSEAADTIAALRPLADIGREWLENSSLEKWFPITAEELKRLQERIQSKSEDLAAANAEIARLREDEAGLLADIERLGQEADAAIERAEAAERERDALLKDAERFRWLRNYYTAKPFDKRTALVGEDLAIAVDAAMLFKETNVQ